MIITAEKSLIDYYINWTANTIFFKLRGIKCLTYEPVCEIPVLIARAFAVPIDIN